MDNQSKQDVKNFTDKLLDTNLIAYFAFGIYLEDLNDDTVEIKSIAIEISDNLSNEEKKRAGEILVNIGTNAINSANSKNSGKTS